MIDLRPVLQVVGALLIVLALGMLAPAVLDAVDGHREWQVFVGAAGFTGFVGAALLLGTRTGLRQMPVRQAYLAATMGWVVPCAFAGLPLAFGPLQMSATDAVFEATSALTTTGSTVIHGLDALPRGLLLWRALLQWLGGIGVVMMALAVLPALNIGGMQMFRIESGGRERALWRVARFGLTIGSIYTGMTLGLTLALWLAGMSGFEAVVHAMSTLSTGGVSTSDASVGHFDNAAVDVVVTLGMVAGGMPFLMFARLVQGDLRKAARDQQVHWYLALLAAGTLVVALWLAAARGVDALDALRHGAFTVASVMTGTGLFTVDYGGWSGLPAAVLFFLAFVGGCAGSTSSGIKVFRVQFLFANAVMQVRQLLRPHAVLIPTHNRRPIPPDVLESVMGFLFTYALAFATLAMALAFLEMDFITAISASVSALSNIGPGFGPEIGPGATFAALPDAAKWLLAGGMVFGRLELITVMVLFLPAFWRQ